MNTQIDKLMNYYCDRGPVILLESQSKAHKSSRISYLAAIPEASIKAKGRQIEIAKAGNQLSKFEANPWSALAKFYQTQTDYLFGYLGYDLKNHTETLKSNNQDHIDAPDLFFMVPSLLLKIDHKNDNIEAIKGEKPNLKNHPTDSENANITNVQSTLKRQEYLSKIKQIHRDIYNGKYYELNFTHQLQGSFSGSGYNLYQRMRQAGQVPFGAYISADNLQICCASPERFLRKQGQTVLSQPIKGTIKRSKDKIKDQQLKQQLLKSSKNRAENIMIVDLVRNDLGRIAKEGSVNVRKLFDIQSFSTVHQMVSTIEAATDLKNPVHIIRACFPMGSMTGAPKINVMRHIEKLENYKRGIYSGAMGYITPKGNFDFNVVIRTAIIKNNRLYYAVGGAITADSDAGDEWDESWLKAEALLKAVKCKQA